MPVFLTNPYRSFLSICLPACLIALVSSGLLFIPSPCQAKDPPEAPSFSRVKMLTLVNKARQDGQYCGKKWYAPAKKLKWNDQLEEAAKDHSLDMDGNSFFSHKGSDNHFVDDRLYTRHYFWSACGENVAYGILYEDIVVKEWLKSPGHCANIMNPVYTEIGAWLSGMYWTQVLAKPQNQ
jgi:uncharacterized protein YkwD